MLQQIERDQHVAPCVVPGQRRAVAEVGAETDKEHDDGPSPPTACDHVAAFAGRRALIGWAMQWFRFLPAASAVWHGLGCRGLRWFHGVAIMVSASCHRHGRTACALR
ncbi:MAG: hypothetical protein OXR07_04760 [Nitrospira sp.]|nr:hypothetical protein [Nitrospira sp.]